MFDMDPSLHRIIDAEINRIAEAVRVAEEYFRFTAQDTLTYRRLKELRHRVRSMLPRSLERTVSFRDSVRDPGAELDESSEIRSSAQEVARLNFKRAQEALRSVEEYLKAVSSEHAAMYKRMRFELYTLEKKFAAPLEKIRNSGLYVIFTEEYCSQPYDETIRMVLDGGADIVQLREKTMNAKAFLKRAEEARTIIDRYDSLLIINDRPDIARICGADGVHVGQDDLDPASVRSAAPSCCVGKSTHSPDQVKNAVHEGADYIGVGPVFSTSTKQHLYPIGLETAAQMAEQAEVPAFAIGGITRDVCSSLKEQGILRVCVCRSVISSDDPAEEAAYFARMFKQ